MDISRLISPPSPDLAPVPLSPKPRSLLAASTAPPSNALSTSSALQPQSQDPRPNLLMTALQPQLSRQTTPLSDHSKSALPMSRSASGSTLTPRALHSLAPRPPRAQDQAPTIFEHEVNELDRRSRPNVIGETVMDFRCARPAARPHPRSFTEDSANSKLTLGKRKAGGRKPSEASILRKRAAEERAKNMIKPTRFRVDHPVKAQLNVDVWTHIFEWTDPSTLFNLRGTARFFRYIITLDRTWKASRVSTFGLDMPGPPKGISERTYCEYFTGNYCHQCEERPVRKVFWAFLRRWCNECYRKLTLREREAKAQLEKHFEGTSKPFPDLLDTLMSATRDSWGHYLGAGSVRSMTGLGDGRVICYKKKDIEQLKTDYSELLDGETPEMTPEEVAERRKVWLDERKAGRDELLEHIRKIEAWHRDQDSTKKDNYIDKRDERRAFFKRKAAEADITESELDWTDAYQRAAKIPKAPSERAWEILLPKVREELASPEFREHQLKEYNWQRKTIPQGDGMPPWPPRTFPPRSTQRRAFS